MVSIRHRGASLVELLVVLGILAVLVALLLPAVQKIREAASRVKSQNKMKQYAMAMHLLADKWEGNLPVCSPANGDVPTHILILTPASAFPRPPVGSPYGLIVQEKAIDDPGFAGFLSPADPTPNLAHIADQYNAHAGIRYGYQYIGDCSYPTNGGVFGNHANPKNLNKSFTDGLSNTIMIAERYANCGTLPDRKDESPMTLFGLEASPSRYLWRRPTFADWPFYNTDIHPVRDVATGGTVPSVRGVTFQVRPTQADCNPAWLSTPHPAMLTAMFDGGVRSVRPGVSDAVFWAAVTPDGGEVGTLE